jgi:peptidoglycan L-alanyl-D-glutamate endopeptidase CwlK
MKLHPDYRSVVSRFINSAYKKGYKLRITETYRTAARQNELYAKGRTAPGKRVTNARGTPPSSIHQFGIAFDCVEMGETSPTGKNAFSKGYPKSRWGEVGAIGKSFGFTWGGDFRKLYDGPHFQCISSRASSLRKKVKNGQIIKDPKLPATYVYPKVN